MPCGVHVLRSCFFILSPLEQVSRPISLAPPSLSSSVPTLTLEKDDDVHLGSNLGVDTESATSLLTAEKNSRQLCDLAEVTYLVNSRGILTKSRIPDSRYSPLYPQVRTCVIFL